MSSQKVAPVHCAVPQIDVLKHLRELCGYVENGTSDVVTLFQDDATKAWILKLGTGGNVRTFSASSIAQVIEGAADAIKA